MTTEQAERNPIDVLAEDFADKCRRGLQPSVEDYVRQYPHLEKEIRDLLPAVAMMEQLKTRKKVHTIPEKLGEYHILREIGRGGMGVVYEAEHKALGRRVALKVAPMNVLIDPVRMERFQREAQAAARLHHTNIVPVFAMGESQGMHYIVMQHIAGCGLNEVLTSLRSPEPSKDKTITQVPKASDPRYWRWVAQIGVQVAEALGYAHEYGTLHRDIKPSNILLDSRGTAWVADFGLAKISGRDALTHTGDIIGTVQYMSPEAARGKADSRSDIYSLAVTLYELLTLRPPYPDLNTLDLLTKLGELSPPRPRSINPAIPEDLDRIIVKASARKAEDRYQTAGELADDLRRFLEDRPVSARPGNVLERFWRLCRRNRAVAALSGAAAALLVLALSAGWAAYVSTYGALARESHRRADADDAKNRADENVQMSLQALESIFNQLEPFDGFADPGPVGNREGGPQRGPGGPPDGPPRRDSKENLAILQNVLSFYERFAEKNETNPTLQFDAAKAYSRVGEIQSRQGESGKAAENFKRAMNSTERLHAIFPENNDYSELLGQLHCQLGMAMQRTEPLKAEEHLRSGVALQKRLIERAPDDERYRFGLAQGRLVLADSLAKQNKFAESRPLIEDALSVFKSKNEPRMRPLMSRSYRLLSDILRAQGDEDGAAKALQEEQKYRGPREFRPEGDRRPPPPREFDGPDRRRPD